jgi:hypothetical protein
MKRIVKTKWLVFLWTILLLPLLGGCQDDSLPDSQIRLSQIPDNPDYVSLPLIGTDWKLIGFVDGRRGRVKRPHSAGNNSYMLVFHENGVVSGRTITNLTHGNYSLENEKLSISDFREVTEAGRFPDDDYFIESVNKIFKFLISTKGLELHLDSRRYLLFEPLNQLVF